MRLPDKKRAEEVKARPPRPPSSVMNSLRLIDHLVGAREQRGWHFDANGLGGLEIDGQLKLGRLHD